MATLSATYAASPLDSDNASYHTFTDDTDLETTSYALDNMPGDFGDMVSLSWEVDYSLRAALTNDTYGLDVRIMNGATVLAAGDSGGGMGEC